MLEEIKGTEETQVVGFTYVDEDGNVGVEEEANCPNDVTRLHLCNIIVDKGGLDDIGAVKTDETEGVDALAEDLVEGDEYDILVDTQGDSYRIKAKYSGMDAFQNEEDTEEEYLRLIKDGHTFWTYVDVTKILAKA